MYSKMRLGHDELKQASINSSQFKHASHLYKNPFKKMHPAGSRINPLTSVTAAFLNLVAESRPGMPAFVHSPLIWLAKCCRGRPCQSQNTGFSTSWKKSAPSGRLARTLLTKTFISCSTLGSMTNLAGPEVAKVLWRCTWKGGERCTISHLFHTPSSFIYICI